MVAFNCRVFPTFLNAQATDESFQQTGKQDSFKHILKRNKGESSGSQFIRATIKIES